MTISLHHGLLAAALSGALTAAVAQPGRCEASSGARQTHLVELYTSEGCDSCPPADRWLSTLKGRSDVLAAAFHVDYWDSLGWKDRFGDPAHSARQAQVVPGSGARFSYTPQVLVNGRDWRRWPALPPAEAAAPVQIRLQREDALRVQVEVTALPGAPQALTARWALLEDDHGSAVKAGENRGAMLRHDHVVRAYGRQPAWRGAAPQQWSVAAPRQGEGGRPARLLLVVTDQRSGLPLQAVQLAC
ncbi:DUF1223 domain-containing protein [Aquincola sp. S2]|uniref:DUF1223 domain-containing protein n=1 Tax=Pseudaquabacterium terrae TaxID=2732868 RepID=A0ABX2EN83_9BURK|nr:DUF1223 domain-containing protein [Aquabacterium terrae]NRF70127.1 DUF1223 domain-containing protein [Aquabacterium terrae]